MNDNGDPENASTVQSDSSRPTERAEVRRALLQLMLVSGSALFWELAFIRWVPGSVTIVGYFTNLVLIASFLGLGAGALLSRFDIRLFDWWPVTMFVVVASSLFLGLATTERLPGEMIWIGDAPLIANETVGWLNSLNVGLFKELAPWMQGASFYLVMTWIFVAIGAHFVLIGPPIGRRVKALPPQRAYPFDIGGSNAGLLLFAACSFLSLPPIVWFSASVVGLSVLTRWRSAWGIGKGVLVAVSLALVALSGLGYYWSPYYKIEVSRVDMVEGAPGVESKGDFGYRLRVNNDYHQMALDLSENIEDNDFTRNWRMLYDLPYAGGHEAGRVLIVGAGSGNDVQSALRNGATHVTAVEIDPRIVKIGKELHPESPYDDPRVHVVVDDARSYFKGCTEKYDTIVFGFLDSHTLLSSFGTLRIDNYVYTRTAMEEAVSLLDPGGRIAVTFVTVTPWLKNRLGVMIALALGKPPYTLQIPFTAGRVFWGERGENWAPPDGEMAQEIAAELSVPTDEWPFLYMESPNIPTHYLYFLLLVVALGGASFFLVERSQRRLNLQFFFLGAGFMLLETRSITEIALLFGSTWVVNTIAFTAVLLAVLAANILVEKSRWMPPVWMLYIGVVALLGLGYLLEPGALYVPSVALRIALCCLVLFSPIFLAGMVFSSQFRGSASPNLLFGSNLIGAMVGGTLEYFSLVVGFRPLYLLGGVLYLAAMLAALRKR